MTTKDLRAEIEERALGCLDSGDLDAAAGVIIRGYGSEIMSYLVGVSRDRVLAEEVFSATAEDLWRGLPGFRRQSSVRTWLYRIAWHALQRSRKDAFRRRQTPISGELATAVDAVRSRTAPYLRTEVKDAVAQLREQLSPAEQTLLIMRVDRGMSWREVAEVLAEDGAVLSEATLAKRFERVRFRLRKLASEAGLFDP